MARGHVDGLDSRRRHAGRLHAIDPRRRQAGATMHRNALPRPLTSPMPAAALFARIPRPPLGCGEHSGVANRRIPATHRPWLLRVLASAIVTLAAPTARAVEPLQQLDVILLQPGPVLEQRIEGGAGALATYLQRVGEAADEAVRANPQQLPTGGFVVIALRPGGQSHTWFDFKPSLRDKTAEALTQAVAATPPAPVREGNVVFALRVSVWGGTPPTSVAPVPPEWRAAGHAAGHKLDLDALVDQTWPR